MWLQIMRKFRIWDSEELSKNLKTAIQIRSKIQEIALETGVPIPNIPQSLVPTSMLYDLTVCYEAMYNKLLNLDLVETGNLKTPHINNLH